MELGKLGIWFSFDGMTAAQSAEFAQKVEKLGYRTMWVPEAVGREPFAHAAYLLTNTQKLNTATGIANIWEVCHHLRGEAGPRQIDGAKVALAHVIGLGSACGIHILEKSAA